MIKFKEYLHLYKTMSIKNYVNEMNLINAEIKRVSAHLKNLRKKSKELEEYIVIFLKQKDQPGLKYDNTAIIVETKAKRTSKKKSEAEIDALRVLEENGVENPQKVLQEIIEARKGYEIEQKKLKIKKINRK